MAVNFNMRWSPDLPKVERALGKFGRRLAGILRRGLGDIGAQAAEQLREITPRSNPQALASVLDSLDAVFGQRTDHVADGWVSVRAPGTQSGVSTILIENSNPRWDAPITLKSGGVTSLGTIIEFGSRPHKISPNKKKAMVFMVGGRVVITKGPVYHPGTAPTGVVNIAADTAHDKGRRLMDAAARVVQNFRLSL